MTGMDGARRRAVLCGGLALAMLLVFAGHAKAARYAVAQCGWHIGQDADWSDTTGGAKFRPDSFCAAPEGQDPFDGVHLKSLTRDGAATVSGTRFARWRWSAPAGTAITAVRGTWWHALHDGLEHRIGVGDGSGGFDVFAASATTDTALREFTAGFSTPRPALEARLLCARGEDRSCSLDSGSFAAVRALTITLEDNSAPVAGLTGELTQPGWHRGPQDLAFGAGDTGSGVRFSQTLLDDATTGVTLYPCAQALIGGELRATQMKPCESGGLGTQSLATGAFSDGPHALSTCAADFAGNYGCSEARQVLIDNNPPAAPRGLAVVGGDGWRRANSFDLGWANPDQGVASPIAGASYRITGFDGYDSGVRAIPGDGLSALSGLVVPRDGAYAVQVWLRDGAGNEDAGNAAGEILRFDSVPPSVAFRAERDPALPEIVRAQVADADSGVTAGRIEYRRMGREHWISLPTELSPAVNGGSDLVARFPSDEVAQGSYELRALAVDGAGNSSQTTLRADGTRMVLKAPLKARTRLTASLHGGRRQGIRMTTAFDSKIDLSGRLIAADGRGLGARELSVLVRPARGAFAEPTVRSVMTGPHGGFRLTLEPGTSRMLAVRFAGTEALASAISPGLSIHVRSGVELRSRPAALETGEAVSLTGRVLTRGAPVPRRGKLVAIQYLEEDTHRWRPVLVTRTNRSGHFHARYRFRYVTGTARIRLRAAALPEDNWPYASGYSRVVAVQVSGPAQP